MTKSFRAASLALAAMLVWTAPIPAQQYVPGDESPEDYPAGSGRDDTFYACTACHGFKLIAAQALNRRQWQEAIDLMVAKHGMPALPEKDYKVVLDYLSETFQPRASSARPGWQNPFMAR